MGMDTFDMYDSWYKYVVSARHDHCGIAGSTAWVA